MIVGIDLGTTHSLSGISTPDGGRLFPNPHGDLLTPSVISVDGDSVLVGQAACDRLVSHPEYSIAGFKRWMGTSRETRLGDRTFRPEELSALVLRALIADAEAATGQPVTEAVISVPAYFSDAQRKATRAAGELAGIRVERLINEPTAAALAYGLQQRDGEGRFLVLDLGGGTFDVSILELFDGVVEVHASAGDNFLGGEDFLELLVETFARDSAVDMTQLARREAGQLRRRLEAAKRALTGHQQADVQLQLEGRSVQWQIEEARFAQLAEPLMQRMRTPIERAMRDARLTPDKLDEIVLVGGATRMPMVSRLVTRMFGRLPLRHINPDQTVALGATVAAGLKARDEHLSEVILTDVCPYTLGTQVSKQSGDGQSRGGFFHPIIQRNSAVPVSREDEFYPVNEGQRQLTIDVYQGESPLVANNIKLGALQLTIDPKLPVAQNGVTVRFTYDINGLLQVEARVHASGQRHELVLEQNPGLLDPSQIAERLAALSALKIHPRDQQQNLALIARAERIYEEHLHHRERVQDWLLHFRNVLDSQDLRLIEDHRSRLADGLQSIEAEG